MKLPGTDPGLRRQHPQKGLFGYSQPYHYTSGCQRLWGVLSAPGKKSLHLSATKHEIGNIGIGAIDLFVILPHW
jgi:hypothetical protein